MPYKIKAFMEYSSRIILSSSYFLKKRICLDRFWSARCMIREGRARAFSETPSDTLVKTIFENQEFPKRIVLYDLSPVLKGRSLCIRLNHTDSTVFREFENFLRKKLKAKLKPLFNRELDSENYPIVKLA